MDDFPPDIWIEIGYLIDPSDAFALQQTCRAIRQAFDDKSVWTRILRLMCERNAIFVATFPVADMDLKQLQRAALGPSRLAKMVKERSSVWNADDIADMLSLRPDLPLIPARAHTSVSTRSLFGENHETARLTHLVAGGWKLQSMC